MSNVLQLSEKHSLSVDRLTMSFPHDGRLLVALQGVTLEVMGEGSSVGPLTPKMQRLEEREPGIKVEVVGGMHDDRIIAALRDGTGPSVVSSFESGNFGTYASAAGLVSAPLMSVYNVSKHAVVTLSETLFHDLRVASAKLGVSVLCPAFVPTNIRSSERNRPPALTDDAAPTPSQIAARERAEKAVASGRLSAAEVAGMTFEAVRENRFYVITHRKMLGSVELRMQDIVAQRNPTDPYTFKPEVAVKPR